MSNAPKTETDRKHYEKRKLYLASNPEAAELQRSKQLEAQKRYYRRNTVARLECNRARRLASTEADPKGYWVSQAIAAAKRRCKRLSREYSLTIFPECPDVCPVLGISLDYTLLTKGKGVRELSPSLDRIDSSKGYVDGNVWIISWRANNIKRDATLDELRAIVRALESKV